VMRFRVAPCLSLPGLHSATKVFTVNWRVRAPEATLCLSLRGLAQATLSACHCLPCHLAAHAVYPSTCTQLRTWAADEERCAVCVATVLKSYFTLSRLEAVTDCAWHESVYRSNAKASGSCTVRREICVRVVNVAMVHWYQRTCTDRDSVASGSRAYWRFNTLEELLTIKASMTEIGHVWPCNVHCICCV
jgi:hypothetical protein